jgi:hypothetical protein
MTVDQPQNFPEAIEVSGSGNYMIDGSYSLTESAGRWGFAYRKIGSEIASLRYGEEQPEIGGQGFIGWVIGNFSTETPEIFARCIRSLSTPKDTSPCWEVAEGGNFKPLSSVKARPAKEPALTVRESRVLWRLESLRDKLKHCGPGQGLESEAFALSDLGEYKLVLYPFGTSNSAPGCVSLALVRTGGSHRMLRFFMRIGKCTSGHKIMAGSEFAVDFSRAAIQRRLEALDAELNIVL